MMRVILLSMCLTLSGCVHHSFYLDRLPPAPVAERVTIPRTLCGLCTPHRPPLVGHTGSRVPMTTEMDGEDFIANLPQ